jgi:hypothetical protein
MVRRYEQEEEPWAELRKSLFKLLDAIEARNKRVQRDEANAMGKNIANGKIASNRGIFAKTQKTVAIL